MLIIFSELLGLFFTFCIYHSKLCSKTWIEQYSEWLWFISHISIPSIIATIGFLFLQACPTRSTRTIFLFCFCFQASPVAVGASIKKITGILYLLNTFCLFTLRTVYIHSGYTNELMDKTKKNVCASLSLYSIWGRHLGGGNRQHEKQTW